MFYWEPLKRSVRIEGEVRAIYEIKNKYIPTFLFVLEI